jgi:hypothetical protein
MAAGITPSESGMMLEPVDLVVDWARENFIRGKFDEPQRDYIEFKESPRLTEGK